jgi:hypothetical protein
MQRGEADGSFSSAVRRRIVKPHLFRLNLKALQYVESARFPPGRKSKVNPQSVKNRYKIDEWLSCASDPELLTSSL